MEIKLYQELPKDAQDIRTKVFIEEQGFQNEYDEMDHIAMHLVAYIDGRPAATCRFFWDKEKDAYILGRLAVLPKFRGSHLGAALMDEVQKQADALGGNAIWLHAQCRASAFYEKQGYQKLGEVELEQNCPHIWMYKQWN